MTGAPSHLLSAWMACSSPCFPTPRRKLLLPSCLPRSTLAAPPSFARVMALVAQHAAARQGSANSALYSLAAKQSAGGASVFHDITSGNNSVPRLAGFNATPGYDQATDLGSIDAMVMVKHWSHATATPAFQASRSPNSLSVTAGSNHNASLTVRASGGFDGLLHQWIAEPNFCGVHACDSGCSGIGHKHS